jgi:hypothetical protein
MSCVSVQRALRPRNSRRWSPQPISRVCPHLRQANPPVIQINGDNPAHVSVGATYQDLGATITGPKADLNLGLKYFLNGQLVSDIVIDTTQVATDTIQYVATDPTGFTSTSTRTVIIEGTVSPAAASCLLNPGRDRLFDRELGVNS